jgi:hypothetical protein
VTLLIEQLQKPTPGWPVPLSTPVASTETDTDGAGGGGGGADTIPEDEADAPPPPIPSRTAVTTSSDSTSGGPGWLYSKTLTRDDSEAKVTAAGLDDGRFVVRHYTEPGTWVLTGDCVFFVLRFHFREVWLEKHTFC